MGKSIPDAAIETLKSILDRMGLKLNEEKTTRLNAKEETFNFLGHTVRYSRDLWVAGKKYWEIMPSKKSEKKIREKINDYLSTHGHSRSSDVVKELNEKIRGWLNYFEIKEVSYTKMSKRRLRFYLSSRLHRYYGRKSQRKSRLYKQNAFEILVQKYGLIDPTKYATL